MVKIVTDSPSYLISEPHAIGQSNWDSPEHLAISQLAMEKLFKTLAIQTESPILALPLASKDLNVDGLSFDDPLRAGRQLNGGDFLNRRLFNDALLVMHRGKVIHESYRNGMTAEDRHVLHSCTKSLCAMLVGIAIEERKLEAQGMICDYIPELQTAAWRGVSVQQVLDMQAGIEYSEDYTNPAADYWRYARAAGYYPTLDGKEAIGVKAWIFDNLTRRSHRPGSQFVYNSCLSNVLGIALENTYDCSLAELFEDKLYGKLGAESDGYFNTDRLGFPIAEGQFNLTLRDFARCAALVMSEGKNLAGDQVLPKAYVESIIAPDNNAKHAYHAQSADRLFPHAQYKNQFWVLNPELKQMTMLGIHGQFAWFDLIREVSVVGFGSFPQQDGNLMMTCLDTLWQTISSAVENKRFN
jgi:CubicO group peptidase (beta-lactamase class C family)